MQNSQRWKSAESLESSLVGGGASSRIAERLLKVDLRTAKGCRRLALVLAAVTWLPLLALSVAKGLALPGIVHEPFLFDITPHIRFLFALPVLILADAIVGPNISKITRQFLVSGLVRDHTLSKFDGIAQSAIRIRDSKLMELVILGIAYVTSTINVRRELGVGGSSWLMHAAQAQFLLTAAGLYYSLVSVPIYQFFLFRWALRFLNWSAFLFRVSRLDLEIVPTHPDRAAGLGFVGQMVAPTSLIVLAASAVFCSSVGTRVMFSGARLEDFLSAFATFVVASAISLLAPYMVFIPTLAAARRSGLIEYGMLATRYTQLFGRKWMLADATNEPELLGTPDIQSLADLGNAYDRIADMKLLPVGSKDLRALLVAALLPAIPLALTQFSLKEVFQMLTKVLF